MWEYFSRMLHGPGAFRILVQPCIAVLIGLHDGIRDSRLGRDPYFKLLCLLRGPSRWREVRGGAHAIAVPLILGVSLSIIFQHIIMSRVRLLPALGFAVFLVAFPYVAARALANRALSAWRRRHPRASR